MISEVQNIDCMEGMKTFPDKFFELAIVDPPYGIGHFTQSDRVNKYGNYKWNEFLPNEQYFNELIRVTEERIIWGANYYNCFENENGAIVWNKKNPHPSMSVCEIASVSFGKRVNYFELPYYGFVGTANNIHPCQKPVALYKWLLQNYAKPGDKILDTHLGSQSSRIAAYKLGFDFWGYEIDADYFKQGCERFEKAIAEPLFDKPKPVQTQLL